MDTDKNRLKPAFDFSSGESSVLLYQGQAEMSIEGNIYAGDGEIRLDLLPRANIHLYGYFSGVSLKDALKTIIGQKEISSFSINGHQIEGFKISSESNVAAQQYNINGVLNPNRYGSWRRFDTNDSCCISPVQFRWPVWNSKIHGTKRNGNACY